MSTYDMRRRKPGKLSIILWVFGFMLIIFGIYIPQNVIFKNSSKNVYTYDQNSFGDEYEFEVRTNESIDVNTAFAKIKIEGVKTKSFWLEYEIGESSYGEYVFSLELTGQDANMSNEVVGLEITANSGKVIEFEYKESVDDFGNDSLGIVLSVIPCLVGVVFIFFGFVIYISRDKLKKVNDKLFNNLFGPEEDKSVVIDEDDEEIEDLDDLINEEDTEHTTTCKYCGLENDKTSKKCEHCGAPIYKKKK